MEKQTKKKYSEFSLETIERIEDSLIEHIKKSGNTILFNLKFVFSNARLLTLISLFYVLAMVISIIFIPIWISGAMFQLITMILPGLIILGTVGSNVRKSTLYKNMALGGVKRRTFYLAQLITIIVIVNLLSLILWTLVWILGSMNVFLAGWVWDGTGHLNVNPFTNFTPILILYVTMVTAFVIFATYFLIESITHNEKTYNLIVVSLLILGIIFGGSLNTYFAYPYQYQSYNWALSGGTDGIDYFDTTHGGNFYVTEEFYNSTNGLKDLLVYSNQNGIASSSNLFPTSIFIPTLFNPFYGVGEFTSTAITKTMCPEYCWFTEKTIVVVKDFTAEGQQIIIDTLPFATVQDGTISIWSWFQMGLKDGAWMWTAVLLQPYFTIVAYLFIGKTLQVIKDDK